MINSTKFASNMSVSNSIAPAQHKSVYINGKSYPVVKVQDTNSTICSFAPRYKEVVIIDGKQYDLKETPSLFASDSTNQVVVVDGKQYPVDNNIQGFLKETSGLIFGKQNQQSLNEDVNLNYLA